MRLRRSGRYPDLRPPKVIPWQAATTDAVAVAGRARSRLTAIGIGLSVVLVMLKGYAGIVSASTAVVSDALNSLMDIVSYTALTVSVAMQNRPADLTHHYGHGRAEPMAGLLIAILGAILGSVIIRDAIIRFVDPVAIENTPLVTGIVVFAIAAKIVMGLLYHGANRDRHSPALSAAATDSRNDVLASSLAFVGLVGGSTWDTVAGLAIGAWILASGARMGLENIGFLMGRAPSEETLARLGAIARTAPGVLGTNNIRAHFVGNQIHVEIHIEVDERMSVRDAHDIAKAVGRKLEELEDVLIVFVHADPVIIPSSSEPGFGD